MVLLVHPSLQSPVKIKPLKKSSLSLIRGPTVYRHTEKVCGEKKTLRFGFIVGWQFEDSSQTGPSTASQLALRSLVKCDGLRDGGRCEELLSQITPCF